MNSAVTGRFRFYIDFAGDGSFSIADEITAYVRDARWTIGMSSPYQLVADETRIELTLVNKDKRFSPEVTTSPYYPNLKPQKLVKVEVELNGVTTPLYLGFIDRINPSAQEMTSCLITAVSAKQYIQEQKLNMPLLQNVRADEILEQILERVHLPPSMGDAWLLGIEGASELGESTYLNDLSLATDFDTGNTTFAYVADTWDADFQGNQYVSKDWGTGFRGYTAIADVVKAELGRFYFDREGKAVFKARDWLQKNVTLGESYTQSDFVASKYEYGIRIFNRITSKAYPRVVSASPEVIHENADRFQVNAGNRRTLRTRFTSNEGYELAALDPYISDLTLVPGSAQADYVVEWEARGGKFEFNAESAAYAHTNIEISANTVKSLNEIELVVEDGLSISQYGLRTMSVDSKLSDNQNLAQSIAEYRLNQWKNPKGEMLWVELFLDSDAKYAQALNSSIGDRINISDSRLGHDADYFIIGEMFAYRKDSGHKVRWYLERADGNFAWILGETGYSELGETTFLGV